MMKINHLTILFVAVVLFLISLIVEKKTKVELLNTQYEYNQVKQLSGSFGTLKKEWNDKNEVDIKLDKIIKLLGIKNISIKKDSKKIEIVYENESLKNLDRFVNKILNDTFIIKSLNIENKKVQIQIGYR